MKVVNDLSTEDIIFLRAVRDINANPGDFEATDRGEMPANKTSIQKATDLSARQVEYRLTKRGMDKESEDGMGLILVYGPTLNEEIGSFGPKSAELTQKGVKVLSEWDESGVLSRGTTEDVEDEKVSQLEARIESLEKQQPQSGDGNVDPEIVDEVQQLREDVHSLQSTLDEFTESEWGALEDDVADQLEKIIRGYTMNLFFLQEVLGADIESLAEHEGKVPRDEIMAMRESAYQALKDSTQDDSPEFNPPSV